MGSSPRVSSCPEPGTEPGTGSGSLTAGTGSREQGQVHLRRYAEQRALEVNVTPFRLQFFVDPGMTPLAPLSRSRGGSIRPILDGLDYADPGVALLGRSVTTGRYRTTKPELQAHRAALARVARKPSKPSPTRITLLVFAAQRRVGRRPERIEPRAVKRRPKQHPLLPQPRPAAREHVGAQGHPSQVK
jgi:hypothetical protein